MNESLNIVADLSDAMLNRVSELSARVERLGLASYPNVMLFTFGREWRCSVPYKNIETSAADPLAALLAFERLIDQREQSDRDLAATLGIDLTPPRAA